MNADIARRLVMAAYEQGWRDACDDHLAQKSHANYPIGEGKRRDVASLLDGLDPLDLLGLR